MKIKCFRFPCEVCGDSKAISSIQVFFRKNGEASYAKARHCGEDKKFYYHQQSKEYVKEKLRELSNIDHGQALENNYIDQTKAEARLNCKLEPSAGFGSATITLPIKMNSDLYELEKWVRAKYSPSYRRMVLCYVKKYSHLLKAEGNLRELELMSNNVKSSVVKSLLLYSKFNGCYSQFKGRLGEYGIKLYRPDSLNAFLRILNVSNSDILEYYSEILPLLRDNERVFAKFLLNSGLRVSEGIKSFNLIISLSNEAKLSEYYYETLSCLMHFKYPKLFSRQTKNGFITFIQGEFLEQMAECQPVTYFSIRKRLERNKKPMRFNEFRDYFGTQLVNNGILEAEQNLVCGRISISIFIRHYWSPKLKELGTRILEANSKLEKTLLLLS